MYDWRVLRWLNYVGWWPKACKTEWGYRIARVVGVALFFSDFFQLGPEFIRLFEEMSTGSLQGTIPNLTTTLMGILCAVKIYKLLTNGDLIEGMINKLIEMDLRAKEVLDDDVYKKHSKYRDFLCKLSTRVLLADAVTTVSWSGRPLVLVFFGTKALIIDSWIPWNWKASWFSWLVVYVIQAVHVSTAMYGLCIYDSLTFSLIEVWLLQVDFLKEAFTRLDFTPPSVDRNGKVTLSFCAAFYQDIRDIMSKINDFIKHVILWQSVVTTAVICLTLFESSSVGDTPLVKKINLYQLLSFMVYNQLLYSLICQEMESANEEIFRATYDNNWYIGTNKDKRAVLMITEQCKVQDHFGYIVHSNLDTFIGIMKTSFTYFNFLQAISTD